MEDAQRRRETNLLLRCECSRLEEEIWVRAYERIVPHKNLCRPVQAPDDVAERECSRRSIALAKGA
jgi:hypothetical protein